MGEKLNLAENIHYTPAKNWIFQSDSEERKSEKPELKNHLTALLASNLLSLALGAAVGYWLFRKTSGGNLVNKTS